MGGAKSRVTADTAGRTVAHVALLRGINVGGKRIVPMADLVAIFEQGGAARVRTYIQSGNVVFATSPTRAARIASGVAGAIEARFGFAPGIVVRRADEMAAIMRANPLVGDAPDEKALHVGFMERAPARGAIARLDPGRSPGDRFAVQGLEVYLLLANGMARTKLTNAYFDSALGVVTTFRNWRTVTTLAGMCAEG